MNINEKEEIPLSLFTDGSNMYSEHPEKSIDRLGKGTRDIYNSPN